MRVLGHKQELFIEAPVRIPVVPMAWYTDMFPVEKEPMVVLTKISAIREWLVILMLVIRQIYVITTVLCVVVDATMMAQIVEKCICLNVLNPAIARKRDMTCLTAVPATEM